MKRYRREPIQIQLGPCTTNKVELTMRVRLRVVTGSVDQNRTTAS